MKVYIGADHAGFRLKEQLKRYLSKSHNVVDVGAKEFVKTDDYPDYAAKVARKVQKEGRGIVICGSAEGVCIAANKFRGIRAVPVWTVKNAKLSREHNDANVLCLSGWDLSLTKAKSIVNKWLRTEFSGAPRHVRRLRKISKL